MARVSQRRIEQYSDISKYPLVIGIKSEFQPYHDIAEYKIISKVKKIVRAIEQAFELTALKDIEELIGYTRHILHWDKGEINART